MILNYSMRWIVLVLLGLLIYGQTSQFDFVGDDYTFIVNNPYIKNFSYVHFIWHYFPLTRSVGFYSFALNYFFNQLHPQGFHIFNLIVHFIAVGLVWALADLLFRITKWIPSKDRLVNELPFIIAVIFLVHPCQTQAVSYISQRFESMATVFYLGTVYCYLRGRTTIRKPHKFGLFGLAGLLTILGLLTKEVIITVPAMLLASEWILLNGDVYQLKIIGRRHHLILIVYGVLLYELFTKLVHADLSIFLQSIPSQSHDGDVLTPVRYFLTQMRVFLTFLRLLVLPFHQNLDYDYPASTGLLHPPLTLVGLCVIGFIVFLIIKLRRNAPLIAFGLAWILITFSINMAPRSNVIFEHKLYLISFGFILTTVAILSNLVHDRRTLVRILWCMITVLALVSFQRNKVWKDSFTLWSDTVRKSPHKARPYINRGLGWDKSGNFTQAMADYNRAIKIDPTYSIAYVNRGNIYDKQGNLAQAMANYNRSIEIDPTHAEAYYNRGLVYQKQGKSTQAILEYNRAIELDLNNADAYYYRGVMYNKQGNFTQALLDFSKAIGLNPDYAEAYTYRGIILARESDFTQAMADLNKAIELDPNYVEAYISRGIIFARESDFTQAMFNINKAIKINSSYAVAFDNRAVIYYQLKEYDKAWADVKKAQALGAAIDPEFISELKKASGEDR